MKHCYIAASLAVLLGWASFARAQASLGSPVPRLPDPAHEPIARPLADHRPFRGLFWLFSPEPRHRFTPLRSALAHLFPTPPTVAPVSDVPTREDIERMTKEGWHSPAEISAAKIRFDEAQAKPRCAAVRYLANVDCHYYPEAEFGLIAALRADRNESVRLEAAVAIGQCRGVTLRMIDALNLTAQGMDTDGNPAETSERVRTAARMSLQRHWTFMAPPIHDAPPKHAPPDWHRVDPRSIHPAEYGNAGLPAPGSSLPPLPAERERAETVGASFAPPPARRMPRTLFEVLFGVNDVASPSCADTSSERERILSARMRGLRPLGSEFMLAIPATPYNVDGSSPR